MLANMPPDPIQLPAARRPGRATGARRWPPYHRLPGRSHDDYYFVRPEQDHRRAAAHAYVDVSREEIARRVISKEVLRRAFRQINLPAGGDNVHGEFGTVDQWPGRTERYSSPG